MHILGINAYHGDVSATLLEDGRLVAALEEERFRRIKHVAGFPAEAIRRCLAIAGIDGRAVDHVAVSRDPTANLWEKAKFVLKKRPSIKLVWERLQSSGKVLELRGPLADALGVEKSDLPTLHNVEHHPAHLASAFFVSPYDEAAVASIDGMGDFVSTSTATGHGARMELLDKVYYPHSLGILYTALTQYLGFPHYGNEYKVMGLAPYGEPNHTGVLRELVELKPGGDFELALEYFRHWSEDYDMDWEEGAPAFGAVYTDELEALLGPPRAPGEPLTQRHEDLARSLQAVHEEAVFHVLNALYDETRQSRLCLAGGCAMNSVANGKVRANTPFEEVYIQPAAADNGTALGAAYWVYHQEQGRARVFEMDHVFWGTRYDAAGRETDVEALAEAKSDGVPYDTQTCDDMDAVCERAADLLADGHIVGWFQGRMEWGARALGSRSILADPRREDARDLINAKVKYREEFRPFAPSILAEAVDEYFVDAAADPFMQQVYPIRGEKRAELPAVTHEDGTGRLQAVHQETNGLYHRLISAFAERTGTPVVLNTSFNENEPIVESPGQALDCFFRTQMDAVVIGQTIVQRAEVATPTPEKA
jgi:carbamoyltransferase